MPADGQGHRGGTAPAVVPTPEVGPTSPEVGVTSPEVGVTSPLADQLDRQHQAMGSRRRRVVRWVLAFYLVTPFIFDRPAGAAKLAFLAVATAALLAITFWIALRPPRLAVRAPPWPWLVLAGALGAAILAVGGIGWIGALIVAAAGGGRVMPNLRLTAGWSVGCAAAGLAVVLTTEHMDYGNDLTVVLVPLLVSFFAYNSMRGNELVFRLRETRAELARMAVAEERLRIARDLHDLLGHSLSLITLKAELAGRLVGTDAERAGREIAELEAVARGSLGDVRAAVTSYRQPSLDAELASARQLLGAAGIDCRVVTPGELDLTEPADALLAWTVREGVTNVVRHSGARGVTVTASADGGWASAEVADDGVGPPLDDCGGPGERAGRGSGPTGRDSALSKRGGPGSGLAGLAERAHAAGGQISAGQGHDGKGFRLLVRVPVTAADGPAAVAEGVG